MNKRYELIIFDWDGTIMDSAAKIVRSMQLAAESVGLVALDESAIKNIIGLGLKEAIETLYPEENNSIRETIREAYAHYYVDGDKTPSAPFEGAVALLDGLKDEGYTLAVATGKSRRGLDRVFAESQLGSYFCHSRCADETVSKPHPRMLQEILRESGFDAQRAIMVGDTEYDLEMATNARMDSLGVSYGAHHRDRLKPHNPIGIVDHVADIFSAIHP